MLNEATPEAGRTVATSPDVTSLDVTESRKKRNQGQFDFLRQKIW
jgi:hypothetical protein